MVMRLAMAFVTAPPRSLAIRLGRGLGGLVHTLGIRRRVVLENLRIAFPERTERERSELAGRVYRHFGEMLADLGRLPRWSDRDFNERIVIENRSHFDDALAQGRGVIVATGHLGGFEAGPAGLQSLGYQVTSIYAPIRNPYVDRYMNALRTLRGARVAARGIGIRGAIEALRRNEMVAIFADQDAGRNGLFIPFFGRTASTLYGPAELALRTGAALVPGFILKDGPVYRFLPRPPIPHSDRETMMRTFNALLEGAIRKYPDQYFWLHKRWKTPLG